MKKSILFILLILGIACQNSSTRKTIGFLDFVKDETLEQARKGYFDALEKNGFSEKKGNLEILYRNALGDQPNLVQSLDFLVSRNVDVIAANTTLSTITAVQRNKTIPVCMMVAPRPDLAHLTINGKAPSNLFGVFETLDYIDTAVSVIKEVYPEVKKLGTLYNQSEPQSVDALKRIQKICNESGIELIALPAASSADAQLVTEAVLAKKPDAFFALPDNIVFSAFETIVNSCTKSGIPIFTSEEGLVKRGALAGFGADMYQWGYQAGIKTSEFFKTGKISPPEVLTVRKKVFNPAMAKKLHLQPNNSFSPVK